MSRLAESTDEPSAGQDRPADREPRPTIELGAAR